MVNDMKCKKHPKYLGHKLPSSDCHDCLMIWQEMACSAESNLVKIMAKGQHTLEELGITAKEIRALKDAGYRVEGQLSQTGKWIYSILTAAETSSLFISGKPKKGTEQEYRWVELSDIHCGSKQFDEQGFRDILKRGLAEGYTQAHISGDLHDGIRVYPGHEKNLRYHSMEDQQAYLAEILNDYPYQYIACTGNHDEAFVKHGGKNPCFELQTMVPNFTFLNSYAADLIIGGIAKRMVHLDGGRAYARSYPGQTYARNLLDSSGENIYVQGSKYRLRFIQIGHLHYDVAFWGSGINFTHPGNFQFPNDYTIRRGLVGPQGARFTRAIINSDGQVVEYESKFVTPRRQAKNLQYT